MDAQIGLGVADEAQRSNLNAAVDDLFDEAARNTLGSERDDGANANAHDEGGTCIQTPPTRQLLPRQHKRKEVIQCLIVSRCGLELRPGSLW